MGDRARVIAYTPQGRADALPAGIVGRLGDATRQRISTLEHLRKGSTWDDQEFPKYLEERQT